MKRMLVILLFVQLCALSACTKKNMILDTQKKSAFETAETAGFFRIIELQTNRMNGPDVGQLQANLIQCGFYEIGEIDGYYGPATESAIKKIQYHLRLEQNGKVDKPLWDFMFVKSNSGILKRISDGIIVYPEAENDYETDGMGTITAYKGKDVSLVIPAVIDSVTITAVGDHVFDGKDLESVIIPYGIITIGESAFINNKLKRITIGANVSFIERDLNSPPIGYGFETSYDNNDKAAGTYTYTNKNHR